jgi:hypothetical protein
MYDIIKIALPAVIGILVTIIAAICYQHWMRKRATSHETTLLADRRSRYMMKEEQFKNCFVSYSHKDVNIVHPIVLLIRAMGGQVFRDKDYILPGKRWRVIIGEALAEANVMVVFWSKNSAISAEVRAEYEEAIKMGKDIIPVLLDDTKLPQELTEFEYIPLQLQVFLQSCMTIEDVHYRLAKAIIQEMFIEHGI